MHTIRLCCCMYDNTQWLLYMAVCAAGVAHNRLFYTAVCAAGAGHDSMLAAAAVCTLCDSMLAAAAVDECRFAASGGGFARASLHNIASTISHTALAAVSTSC